MGAELAYKTDPQLVWVPLTGDSADIFREGMIITNVKANKDLTQDGFLPLGTAVGAADTTAFKVPFGIITGFNTYPGNELYDSTYHAQYVTSIASVSIHAATAQYLGGQSEHTSYNDGQAKALVALLDPCSYIKMPIYNGAYGTAITVGTVSAAGVSTTGAGFATAAAFCDFTPVAGLCTVYCRKGANMGTYRVTSDTDTSTKTVYDYFRYDIAAGDTFVSVPLRLGTCYLQLTAEACFVDASASPGTNYYIVDVVELNLREAGKEYCIFKFQPDQYSMARA
jgi:hypothetical protein